MKKLESLNNDLFKKFNNEECVLDNVLGGTVTCYGSSTLDHYGDSGCDDIEYSSASNKKDWEWEIAAPTDSTVTEATSTVTRN